MKVDDLDYSGQGNRVRAKVVEALDYGNQHRRHFQTGRLITAQDYLENDIDRGLFNKEEAEAAREYLAYREGRL